MKRPYLNNTTISWALAFMLSFAFCSDLHAQVECLKNAFETFEAENYRATIRFGDKCIDEFGRQAERMQRQLEQDSIPKPPVGTASPAEKDVIFRRGVLNDVGTAYYFKGRSAEYLYKQNRTENATYREMAVETYIATCRYRHARTWDPEGWFWSPCEVACDRLYVMLPEEEVPTTCSE